MEGGEARGVEGEAPAVDDHAADEGAVPTDPLRRGVDDDVGALIEGPAEVAAAPPGVVDDQGGARGVGGGGDGGQVGHRAAGVGDRLHPHRDHVVVEGGGDGVRRRRHGRDPQAPRLEPLPEQREGPAERLLRQHHPRARPRQREQRGGRRRLPEASATAATPPSSERIRSAKASTVGLCIRAYWFPVASPAKSAAAWAALSNT
jgi:hypothetical protein